MNPTSIKLFTYRVGFGDCFLLRFGYPDRARHVLIDFGSSAPAAKVGNQMLEVAEHVAQACGGRLEAIVASHRHSDHISGFAGKTWKIIRALDPQLVLLPWTEDPRAAPDARAPTRPRAGANALAAQHVAALQAMREVVESAMKELRRCRHRGVPESDFESALAQADGEAPDPDADEGAVVPFNKTLTRQLAFLGEKNLPNLEQVKNLMTLPREFLSFGKATRLSALLPGVKVHVLGPPTLEECPEVARLRARDADEFWQLAARAGACAVTPGERPFPRSSPRRREDEPLETRWFLRRMDALRGEELLQLVRALDDAMNNTSLILLFEACGRKLLFPGDAQIESWSHALSRAPVRKLLEGVDLYKVGHHGSGNATPKSLWRLFQKKDPGGGLVSVLSTRTGKHSGVPRRSLLEALEKETRLVSTLAHTAKKDFVIETDLLGG